MCEALFFRYVLFLLHSLGVVQGDVTNGQILTHMWSKGYDSVDTVASWVLLLWLASCSIIATLSCTALAPNSPGM